MLDIVKSVNGVPIRLTSERWFHIVENHNDLAGYYEEVLDTVENPNLIVKGYRGALVAQKEIYKGHYLVVIYKETKENDGFIVTAYISSSLRKEKVVWQKQK